MAYQLLQKYYKYVNIVMVWCIYTKSPLLLHCDFFIVFDFKVSK